MHMCGKCAISVLVFGILFLIAGFNLWAGAPVWFNGWSIVGIYIGLWGLMGMMMKK